MPIVTYTVGGEITRLEATKGQLLSDLLQTAPHAPALPCGGKRRCAKCRVAAKGTLSPPSPEELAALSEAELRHGVRLACCAAVEGDTAVTLPEKAAVHIVGGGELPNFEKKPLFQQHGVAVDIGTTTLAAQLYGENGLLAASTAPNPQAAYGADVISRIGQALEGKGKELANCIRTAVAKLVASLCQQASISVDSVETLVITGNTAMLYLFCGHSPAALSHSPFQADHLFGEWWDAAALSLPCKAAKVYLPRCISAFVGADITTAILASGMLEAAQTALLADIGTNGEMALWHDNTILACSTAAGPAFEGAGLAKGMQGANGAIEHVAYRDGILSVQVIGGGEAEGICGSGILDAMAALLEAKALEIDGFIREDSNPLAAQITETDETRLYLTKHVYITQQDVRMVQLAKSAVCAGMQTLLAHVGVAGSSVQNLYIAGGFGSYIHLGNAAQIGLFPAGLLPAAKSIGNAALNGAAMLLLNGDYIAQCEDFAKKTKTLDLSTDPVFFDAYIDCMELGPAE